MHQNTSRITVFLTYLVLLTS